MKVDIPKIIHFVWVGGGISGAQRWRLQSWVNSNPHYQINLWYDSEALLTNALRMELKRDWGMTYGLFASDQQLREIQDAAAREVRAGGGKDVARRAYLVHRLGKSEPEVDAMLEDIRDSLVFNVPSGVTLCDVRNLMAGGMENVNLYNTELMRRGGNMGAASDILRIELILKYGGVYMDIDIGCREPFEQFKVTRGLALFGRYNEFDHTTTEVHRFCNALIASHPGSQMLQECRNDIKAGYSNWFSDSASIVRYYENIRGSTIELTGPELVKRAVQGAASRTKASKTGGVRPDGNPSNPLEFERWKLAELSFLNRYIIWKTDESLAHDWL